MWERVDGEEANLSTEWIDKLAEELKQKGREAAESYGREQHRAGIMAEQGKIFFAALVMLLEEDFSALRSRLQGSPVSSETALVRESPTRVLLTRSRFPWFSGTLEHLADDIVLKYAQGHGVAGEPLLLHSAERETVHFSFQVDHEDKLHIAESFEETQQQFDRPEELARHIVELLFRV